MNNFPSVLFFDQKFEDEFLFWAISPLNSEKRVHTLYKASKYGVEKVDFTPYFKFNTSEEWEKFKEMAQKHCIIYTVIGHKKVGISDPECNEFEEIYAPCYELIGNSFVILTNHFITKKFPTPKMIDKAYLYYNNSKTKLITEYLSEVLFDIKRKGYVILDDIRFYPSYYLDLSKYTVKYLNYDGKKSAIIYSNYTSNNKNWNYYLIGYEGVNI